MDDQRLTAHLFGELSDVDREDLEARLDSDPEATRELAEMAAVAGLLEEAFEQEGELREAHRGRPSLAPVAVLAEARPGPGGDTGRRTWWAFAAAAVLMLAVVVGLGTLGTEGGPLSLEKAPPSEGSPSPASTAEEDPAPEPALAAGAADPPTDEHDEATLEPIDDARLARRPSVSSDTNRIDADEVAAAQELTEETEDGAEPTRARETPATRRRNRRSPVDVARARPLDPARARPEPGAADVEPLQTLPGPLRRQRTEPDHAMELMDAWAE